MYFPWVDFLEENTILFVNQFGFRENHSSYMTLMVLINKLTQALENGDYVTGRFLNFSKALAIVNHYILLTIDTLWYSRIGFGMVWKLFKF